MGEEPTKSVKAPHSLGNFFEKDFPIASKRIQTKVLYYALQNMHLLSNWIKVFVKLFFLNFAPITFNHNFTTEYQKCMNKHM